MNLIFEFPWVSGVLVAIIAFILLSVSMRTFICAIQYIELRRIIRNGRNISWENAKAMCRSKEAFIAIQRGVFPIRIWCVPERGAPALISWRSIVKRSGLVVIEPPTPSEVYIELGAILDRVVEIDLTKTL